MGVDVRGHHREGKDGSNEIEIRTGGRCDRCLRQVPCALWENNTLDHEDGEVSSFSYMCRDCLHTIIGALGRWMAVQPRGR